MSQLDLLLPLSLFAISMGITPGPNNVMLTASGVNFGFRRTVPHMLGVAIGFPAMVVAIGLGLGGLFETYPQIHTVIKYAGIAYLLWLAWKIATAERTADANIKAKPLNFLQAAVFQWVNPKGWVAIVGAIATYTTVQGNVMQEVLVIAVVFGVVTIPCITIWTLFGTAIRRLLRSARARILFNWSMAALLVASLVPFAIG
ncbi:MAG TPA: LysE family translocator [Kiloniellales bacterium]|jgi:threonine/homoserine/homoserine lactone efflux protein